MKKLNEKLEAPLHSLTEKVLDQNDEEKRVLDH